jgi:hypothetical protein
LASDNHHRIGGFVGCDKLKTWHIGENRDKSVSNCRITDVKR